MSDEDIEYKISVDPDTISAAIETAAAVGYSVIMYPDGQCRIVPPRNQNK